MPVSRMRMRPWLEQVIESQEIAGLNWMDKEKTMFSIPWKHAARHGWELEKDASLFKMWAVHTGKYQEGQNSDPKTWKANFRCAMNSLPDIEEVKDRSINKGHQAVRVFKMLPCTPKSKVKQSKAKDSKRRRKSTTIKMEEEEDEEYDNTQSPVSSEASSSTQESTVDSTVNTPQRDVTMLSLPDVPDWSNLVEIGTDFKSFMHKLEVSPEHNCDYDEDIIKICEQLEQESTSPSSPWSDSSSGDDTDYLPQYTTLSSGFMPAPDPWAGFFKGMSI